MTTCEEVSTRDLQFEDIELDVDIDFPSLSSSSDESFGPPPTRRRLHRSCRSVDVSRPTDACLFRPVTLDECDSEDSLYNEVPYEAISQIIVFGEESGSTRATSSYDNIAPLKHNKVSFKEPSAAARTTLPSARPASLAAVSRQGSSLFQRLFHRSRSLHDGESLSKASATKKKGKKRQGRNEKGSGGEQGTSFTAETSSTSTAMTEQMHQTQAPAMLEQVAYNVKQGQVDQKAHSSGGKTDKHAKAYDLSEFSDAHPDDHDGNPKIERKASRLRRAGQSLHNILNCMGTPQRA